MRLNLGHVDKAKRIFFDKDILSTNADDHSIEIMKKGGPYFKENTIKTLLKNRAVYMVSPSEGILFMVTTNTFTLFEVHTMILPEFRGRNAVKETKRAAKWLFENTTCEKLITHVPFFNKQARVFARLAGMKDEGINTKSFKRDGILYDQWVLGLEKEAICQP